MKTLLTAYMLAASSSPAASILAKATVALTLGLAAAWLARKSRAAIRHALLAAVFLVLLLLPAVSIWAPPFRIAVRDTAPQQTAAAPQPTAAPVLSAGPSGSISTPAGLRNEASTATLLLAGWMMGTAIFLLPLATGLWQVRCVRRSALPWRQGQLDAQQLAVDSGIHRRIEILLHESLPGPMTCGVVHPAIVLPYDAELWSPADLRRALVHELEHVRRRDWMTQCLARTVSALYWFHPLVWMAWRQLALDAERSCDDAVLGRSEATAYADQLVALARRLSAAAKSPVLAMANHADLAKRVHSLLDNDRSRGRAGRLAVALAVSFAAGFVAILSPLAIVAAPQSAGAANTPVFAATVTDPIDRPVERPGASEVQAAPQQAGSAAPQTATTHISVNTTLVITTVTVTDANGRRVEGLTANDFEVTEDGNLQPISVFEFQKADALSYYILGYYPRNEQWDGGFRKVAIAGKQTSMAKLDYRPGYNTNNAMPPQPPPAGGSPEPGTTPPVLVYKKEPSYSEVARHAKYQGTTLLLVDVTSSGYVADVKVLRNLGLGLDEQAIESVKQWQFKPATKDGQPVAAQVQVYANFRLL
jgi:TonB family protein